METKRRENGNVLRLSAYCGIAAPVVFILALIIFGWLHPGYSHVRDLVSILSATDAPYVVYMNWLGIIPFGVFILLFSYAYISEHLPGFLGWASGAALSLVGVLFILAGFYICDPGCDIETPSLGASIHNLTAISAFGLVTTAATLIGLRVFRKDKRRKYYRLALICAGGLFGGLIGLGIVGEGGALVGLVQRIFLGFFWTFLLISALNILRWQRAREA